MTEYDVKFQEDMESLMDLFQHVNGFEMQEYTISPPNCVAALLHLWILLTLISQLPPQEQEEI